MSTHYYRYIPEKINTILKEEEIDCILEIPMLDHTSKFIHNKKVQFADCGENFETVHCPYCDSEIVDWWSKAMDEVHKDDFEHLDVLTPCCQKKVSLHYLNYQFPQGFYRSMFEIELIGAEMLEDLQIKKQIEKITKQSWRVIHAHY